MGIGNSQMGWNLVQPSKFSKLANALRQWLLVLIVSWLAGWGAVDMMLRYGGDAPMQVASGEIAVPTAVRG